MRFAEPLALWGLIGLGLLALAGVWVHRRRLNALRRFAGGERLMERFAADVSRHRRALKLLLVWSALAAALVGLARPQWGSRLEEVTREGSDVVVVLDTSLSMAAEDLAPTRLSHATHAVGSLLNRLQGDRVGLVTFAGQAVVNCPLTLDHAAVRLFLDALDVRAVAAPGTALAGALDEALDLLERQAGEPGRQRGRTVVLFTDGEDHEGEIADAVAELRAAGVAVHAVGCGTARGAPIPLRDSTGMLTEYKKDSEGRVVTTRLDEAVLERLALETGGTYHRASAGEQEMGEVARAISSLDGGEFGTVLRTRWEERFQIPLALALAALLAESVLGDSRRRSRQRRPASRAGGIGDGGREEAA